MKTYLPHYFKRIGILFVLTAIIFSSLGGIDDFRRGFFAAYEVEELSSELNIDYEEFGMELFKIRSDIKELNDIELIKSDYKNFNSKSAVA